MARFLKMPGVSADSDAAVLEGWLVEAGASVTAGAAIASVETEKAVVDIEVDDDAVIHALLVESGDTVPVGDPIAVLLAPGEAASEGESLIAQLGGAPAAAPAAEPAPSIAQEEAKEAVEAAEPVAAPAQPAPTTPEPVAAPAAPTGGSGERRFASPLARRMAKEAGLDLAAIQGTGPGGRIVRADVESAASAPEAPAAAAPAAAPASAPVVSPAGGTATPHTKLRRIIASRLQQSKREAPHFYLRRDLRVDALLALRAQVNEGSAVRVSVNDLFVKAAARALVDVPEMNVIWTDDAVVSYATADISIAVASDRGLVTPTIRGIESLSLTSLSAQIKDAVGRANEGRLQQAELEGGTMSITNLGMFGVDEFSAIINPPQASILAIGAATRRAVVNDEGELEAGSVVTVTLSVDHRPVDGVVAARWLDRLAQLVASPMQILL
ncbi:dihydrolipoamide acetyltransferase family protein [Agrococcus jejuensis]|uniref:Dihydrolipoamide acetyltransferase component of pyruvate dehydrogenase complex n=1 Tax=Agrococcus jejuensis TaxID=399736 RepID=A0A1G8FCC7_9MICO|nr:dihydrolipoamide acetyltransferase family protein [Agrococcus jejuensis]SDH79801.1 pyruvate dehydrogenase E2 component (dihydrolipoamide acetyltransferase) [Agrococcus jejuensis]